MVNGKQNLMYQLLWQKTVKLSLQYVAAHRFFNIGIETLLSVQLPVLLTGICRKGNYGCIAASAAPFFIIRAAAIPPMPAPSNAPIME